MAQQTAVEWLIEQMRNGNLESYHKKKGWNISHSANIINPLEQAKAMEKEQIINAHIEGQRVFDDYKHTQWTTDQAEKYYNETHCQYSGLPSVKSYE
jgi:hypothetical protein